MFIQLFINVFFYVLWYHIIAIFHIYIIYRNYIRYKIQSQYRYYLRIIRTIWYKNNFKFLYTTFIRVYVCSPCLSVANFVAIVFDKIIDSIKMFYVYFYIFNNKLSDLLLFFNLILFLFLFFAILAMHVVWTINTNDQY